MAKRMLPIKDDKQLTFSLRRLENLRELEHESLEYIASADERRAVLAEEIAKREAVLVKLYEQQADFDRDLEARKMKRRAQTGTRMKVEGEVNRLLRKERLIAQRVNTEKRLKGLEAELTESR